MNYKTAFPSKYLAAHDLGDKQPIVTIKSMAVETVGDDSKLVIYFEGAQKGLCLNRTNANTIADLAHSEDTDNWIGVRLKLVVAYVDYQGKRVPAVRIEAVPKAGNGAVRPKPKPEPPVEAPDEDSIPF